MAIYTPIMKRLLIMLSMFVIAVAGQQCDLAEITLCTAPISATMKSKSQMVYTKETFQKQCTVTREAIVCLDNLLKRCVGEKQASADNVLSNMQAFLDDFCSESGNSLQEEYFKHVDCLHALDNEIISCVEGKVEKPRLLPPTQEDQLKLMCSTLKSGLSCGQEIATAACGVSAGNILRKVTLRMMPKEPKELCNIQDNAAIHGVQPRTFLTVLGFAATLLSYVVLWH